MSLDQLLKCLVSAYTPFHFSFTVPLNAAFLFQSFLGLTVYFPMQK